MKNISDMFIEINFFDPKLTLTGGQAFRWKQVGDNLFYGIVGDKTITLLHDEKGIKLYDIKACDKSFWLNYFNADIDYSSIIKCFSEDALLKKACRFAYGLRQLRQEPFETLISFIISQSNNIKRIKGIIERLCENFGEKIDVNSFAFPTAKKLAKLDKNDLEPIRAGYRAKYILDAAKKVCSGEIDLNSFYEMPTDEARKELMKINGVGLKVADCVLMCAYGKADAFPKDVWIKRAMANYYPNGLPECTKGYEALANQYLFEYIRSKGGNLCSVQNAVCK